MKRLSPDEFIGYLCGAGVVYIFFALLHSTNDERFSWTFFFAFWIIQFIFILIIHSFRSRK